MCAYLSAKVYHGVSFRISKFADNLRKKAEFYIITISNICFDHHKEEASIVGSTDLLLITSNQLHVWGLQENI